MNKDYSEALTSTHYFLQPGYIFVPDQNISISTVIGSGVSVCIYNRKKLIGGMNHFQFPYMETKGKTTALYGNVSTMALIKMMLAHESRKQDLEAQIFGGAKGRKVVFNTGTNEVAVLKVDSLRNIDWYPYR